MNFVPLVSCIVPIYNAEKYLDQCISSLITQTYNNLEIILVDDRSTDDSWTICRNYARKYPNVLAFRNDTNSGGPLRGREKGIHESHGDWITFMDGDDYVTPEYIENLVAATHEGRFDIAVTGHSRLLADGKVEAFNWGDYSQTTEVRLASFYKHFLANDFWTDPTDTVGQNLIRASICKETDLSQYSNLVYAEDTLMALAFLANSKNGVNFVDKHDFIWRQVEGSGSNGGFSSRANQGEFFAACLDIFHEPDIYQIVSSKSPRVSIIIPVYNVEKYLRECLESVIGQTYRNIEIIIVNDGTTDRSQQIIDEYKSVDDRINTIKQENQGLNMARSMGAAVATGEYIAFIDSDDVIHEDYIKILYENLVKNDVDISICGLKNFSKSSEVELSDRQIPNYLEQVIKDRRGAIGYYLGEIPSVPNVHQMTAWGKLYKDHVIRATDWKFSNYRRNEDNLETLQWYNMADNGISVLSTPLYFYRHNPESITGTLQLNTGPDGEELNYFEFLYVLYGKIKNHIDDESFDVAVLNQLAHTNRMQVQNFFLKGQLDGDAIKSVTENWQKIIATYNNHIQLRDQTIQQQDEALMDIRNSTSWRITRPLRIIGGLVGKLIRK